MKKPIIITSQKKTDFTDYQIDIMESMSKVKLCDIILSIKTDRTPGSHTIQMSHNGDNFIRSLFKK